MLESAAAAGAKWDEAVLLLWLCAGPRFNLELVIQRQEHIGLHYGHELVDFIININYLEIFQR